MSHITFGAVPANAAGFMVSSVLDTVDAAPGDGTCADAGGNCTLRAAIEEVNALGGGGHTISFSVPGAWPHTISPAYALPPISAGVNIDADTEQGPPGARKIILDGTLAGVADGLNVTGTAVTIQGFVVQNFGDEGIEVVGDANTVDDNYVGIRADGSTPAGNDDGILVRGSGNVISNNLVGGNGDDGISLDSADNTTVSNNLVGVSATGNSDVGNGGEGIAIQFGANNNTIQNNVSSGNSFSGILLRSAQSGNDLIGNIVGLNASANAVIANDQDGVFITSESGGVPTNTTIGPNNVISGNAGNGIELDSGASGTDILGNIIGTNASSSAAVGNQGAGIDSDAAGATIGGTSAGDANTIAFNGGDGIVLHGQTGTNGSIVTNSIFSNTGLGINLRPCVTTSPCAQEALSTVTLNDSGDNDSDPPNDLLNYPEITSAVETAGTVTVDFDLDIDYDVFGVSAWYRVEFFTNPGGADPSGFGEGQAFVGSVDILDPPVFGGASGTINFAGSAGDVITATTTHCVTSTCTSFDRTSEFSAAVTVGGGNSPPVLDPVGSQAGDELTLIGFTATASDPDLDGLTFSLSGEPSGASITAGGVFSWTPTAGQGPGVYVFDVVVTDDGSPNLADTETITITVTEPALNSPPVLDPVGQSNTAAVLTNPGDQTNTEGDVVSLAVVGSDTDLPADVLTWSAVGLPPGLGINPATGEISGTPANPGAPSVDYSVTVTVDDGSGGADSVTFSWTVIRANLPPLAVGDTYTVVERESLTVSAPGVLDNDSDPYGDPLTASVVVSPTRGILSLNPDGSLVYMHTAEDESDDSFTYRITDPYGATDSAVVTIDVLKANVAPIGVPDTLVLDEDTFIDFDPLANDVDTDGDVLALGNLVQPDIGIITQLPSGLLRYEPPANYHGTQTAAYTVRDFFGGEDTAEINITVLSINDAPIVVPDEKVLSSYLSETIPVLDNDTDPDGDVLTVVVVTQPDRGEVILDSGTVSFTPPDDWTGTTSFTYTAVDPDGAVGTAKVIITLPDETLAGARSLAVELGSKTLTFATLVPPFVAEAISLTAVESVSLLAGVFYQTVGAFQLPFLFLGLSLLMLAGLGGATRVPVLLAGRVREHWSVVLLDRESELKVVEEPMENSAIIYKFSPITESVLSTDASKKVDGTKWMPVHTPRGDGWAIAEYLTEQVDLDTFTQDLRPAKLVRQFADRLRSGGDITTLIASRGILLALTSRPAQLAPQQLVDLLGGSRLRRLPTVGGALHDQEDFRLAVAEPFLAAFTATSRITAETAHSKTALIPAEMWNFRYLALGEGTSQPWLVFFEYEGGKPKIVGLGIDE